MSDTVAATPAPKKPMSTKKLLVIITTVLALLGVGNYFTFKVGCTTVDVALTDSTAAFTVSAVDTAHVVKVDTCKSK